MFDWTLLHCFTALRFGWTRVTGSVHLRHQLRSSPLSGHRGVQVDHRSCSESSACLGPEPSWSFFLLLTIRFYQKYNQKITSFANVKDWERCPCALLPFGRLELHVFVFLEISAGCLQVTCFFLLGQSRLGSLWDLCLLGCF